MTTHEEIFPGVFRVTFGPYRMFFADGRCVALKIGEVGRIVYILEGHDKHEYLAQFMNVQVLEEGDFETMLRGLLQ